jgi:hypothetical protein
MSAFEAAPAASSADPEVATKTESLKDAYFERLNNVREAQKSINIIFYAII